MSRFFYKTSFFVIFFLIFFKCITQSELSKITELKNSNQQNIIMMGTDKNLDVLKELNTESLELILDELKKYLPKSIRAHHYIYSFLKNHKKQNIYSMRFKPKFYIPRYSNIDGNLTFIAVTDEEDYWILLFTLEEEASRLKDCLENTTLIKWDTKVKPKISVEIDISDDIYKILKTKRNDWKDSIEKFYHLPVNTEIILENSLDLNLKIEHLNENHTYLIDEKWPHRYNNSIAFIKSAIKLNDGFGMFINDELVSWILINDFFALGNLYTVESQRRKGYAELLTKTAIKSFLQNYKIDALVYIMQNNVASEKLFKKIGFKLISDIKWIF